MNMHARQKNLTKIIYFCIMVLILAITGVSFYMKNIYTPEMILKTAVKESELVDKRYILCKEAVTTGFEWIMIRNEDGQKTQAYCNIIGAQPFVDYKLKYEFHLAYNTFIFYIEEKNMVYSEVTKQDEIEYVVTGWDILYPVKHSESFVFDIFRTKKYITEDDLWKE